MANTSSDFDAYFVLLGVPPEQQPPTYYRLLDVQDFEEDTDTIDRGYERRMAYLHTIKSGDHLDAAEELKSELARARLCLLSAEKKAVYDEILREQLAGEAREAATESVETDAAEDKAISASHRGSEAVEQAIAAEEPVDTGGTVRCGRCGSENQFEAFDRGSPIHCCSCGSSIDVPVE